MTKIEKELREEIAELKRQNKMLLETLLETSKSKHSPAYPGPAYYPDSCSNRTLPTAGVRFEWNNTTV
jgi:hypothetical protein